MPKSKKPYSEIDHIREDLDSLKNNVVELTRHLSKDGNAQVVQLGQSLMERVAEARKSGKQQYKLLEKKVKDKPGQTLALAFGAGIIASILMRRR